jgi:hypothetical protein
MFAKLIQIVTVVSVTLTLVSSFIVEAAKFVSNYSCADSVKTCLSSGTRVIDGFTVHKDCWEYSYKKTCNYPSKNDCGLYQHCYSVALRECLLEDSLGNCVNQLQELSCKSWQPVTISKEQVATSLKEKTGVSTIVCKGVPCISGNCIDQSYITNSEMMDSISKLYAVSQAKGATDLNFKLFAGFPQHCSKKATAYTNCCSLSMKGWGKHLGAKCSKDEKDLIDRRLKNLCVYVGKENKQTLGITTVVKHHYCCFGSLLNKVIQVQGRKQLGLNFGSAKNPDCRGLTLTEIMQLDFEKMDFSEFFTEIVKRMKLPNINDIGARINSSLPNIKQYNDNANTQEKQKAGINKAHEQEGAYETQEYGK